MGTEGSTPSAALDRWTWPRDAVVWIGALVGAAATAWALFSDRYLPYIDWSNHLGLISVLAHGDATGASQYFERSWAPSPYLLFYALSALLGQAMPVDVAAKCVLVLTGGALALAAAALAEATGRSPRLGAVGPLALFGLSMGWGFASFVVAMPLFFFALAYTERLLAAIDQRAARRALARGAAELSAFLGLLYLAHGFAYFTLALMLIIRAALHAAARARRGARAALSAVLWLALSALPSVLLGLPALLQLVLHPTVEAGSSDGVQAALQWEPLSSHLGSLWGNLLDRGSVRHLGVMYGAVALWVVGTVLSMFYPRPRRGFGLEIYSALLLLLYFFGPSGLGWPSSIWLLYPRYGVFAGLAVMLLPRVELTRWRLALVAGALGLVLWNASINAEHVKQFSEVAHGFDGVRQAIPKGARVLPLTVPAPGEAELPHHAHGSLYFYLMVDGASFVPFLFDKPELPVHSRPGAARPRAPFWRSPGSYDPRTQGADYDYLVLRGRGLVERTEQAGLHDKVGDYSGWIVFRTRSPPPRTKP